MTIVSHSHKFIFLKSRKTAGTSVEKWLAPALGSRDWIATSPDNEPLEVGFWQTPSVTSRSPGLERIVKAVVGELPGAPKALSLREHMDAAELREVVGHKVWASYFKLTIERHPAERVLSLWHWRQERFGSTLSLDDFLSELEQAPGISNITKHHSNLGMYLIDGQMAVDCVIQYANLADEANSVFRKLGLDVDAATMPWKKGGTRRDEDLALIADPRTAARIAAIYRTECELFGYSMSGGGGS